jgi:predicted site-specific integrase-resolvase
VSRLIRTAEAARALGIGPTTLARWHREGRVRPVLVTAGGQARWDLDDLRRQLDALRPPAT